METFTAFIFGVSVCATFVALYLSGKKQAERLRNEYVEDWKKIIDYMATKI